jgi:hypothetical protein
VSEEDEAVEKISGTFSEIDADRERWATAEAPKADSALAQDDELWPSSPLSSHARQFLVSAWDHFDLIRLTIEQKRGFPTAVNSVLRGALVGAAHARWLLLPDDPSERRERGLAVAAEWYTRRIQWQQEFTPDIKDIDQAARAGNQLRRLDEDLSKVRALRSQKFSLNTTEIIRESTRASFEEEHIAREAVREWRRLGGDAHTLGWQLMSQSVKWGDRGDDGLNQAQVIGDLVTVANAYLLAWVLYRQAIARHDQLAMLSI